MMLSRVFEPPDVLVMTITGVLTSRDQHEFVTWVRDYIRSLGEVRLLVRLEAFAGWKPNAFNDPADWLRDDEPIARMAIVGERHLRLQVLTAMAQPIRTMRIAYFEFEAEAREWLLSSAQRTGSITT